MTSAVSIRKHGQTDTRVAASARSVPTGRPVVVIGAGPYGLSIASHLAARGIDVRVFGEPMASWRHHMPQGLFLKSEPSASSLSAPRPGYSLSDFCAEHGLPRLSSRQPVPIDLFVRYGLWFAERLVPVESTPVVAVDTEGDGFVVSLRSGEQISTSAVVVATGLTGFAHLPSELAAIAPGGPSLDGPVSHSSQHTDLAALGGRSVAVIGAGQSALETAALSDEHGAHVTLLARRPRLVFASPPPAQGWSGKPPSPLGSGWSLFALSHAAAAFRYLPTSARQHLVRTVLGPSGAWWLRPRMQRVEVRTGQRILAAEATAGQVTLQLEGPDGELDQLTVDHVIAATGYRPNLESMGFLAPSLRASLRQTGGSPALTAAFESSTPGLYFAGLAAAATFGPLMRFVCGTRFNATRLADSITARASRLPAT